MLYGNYSRKTKAHSDILLPLKFHQSYTTARQEREKQLQKHSCLISSHRKPFNEVRNEVANDYGFLHTRSLLSCHGNLLCTVCPALTISEDSALLKRSCTFNFRVSVSTHTGQASRGSLCTALSPV